MLLTQNSTFSINKISSNIHASLYEDAKGRGQILKFSINFLELICSHYKFLQFLLSYHKNTLQTKTKILIISMMKKLNWHKIQPFNSCKPTERWGHSSCVIGNDLVVFGGYADSYYMNDLWVFSTLTLQWKYYETTGNIPEPRSNATLNYDKNHNRLILFAGGGQGKKRFNSIYSLDWTTKKWKAIEPINFQIRPWQRTYHVSQIIGKYLVIFGGQNFADLNDIWLFDLQNKKWQEVQVLSESKKPAPRRFHSSILRNNELIIIGGCHGKYRSLKDVFKMDFNEFLITGNIKNLEWKEIVIESSDFIPRWGHSSAYNPLNDKIYIFGGRFSNDLQDIILLDIEKRVSKKVHVTLDDAPCPRRRHSANFIGCSLLVFGGFNGNYFNDLYSICIPTQTPLPKYSKDSVILFSEMLKKQYKDTVSFIGEYLSEFQRLEKEFFIKYTDEEFDEMMTSIVRGYALFPDRYRAELEYLSDRYLRNSKLYPSKQSKIEYIRSQYTVFNVLQEKNSACKSLDKNNDRWEGEYPLKQEFQTLFCSSSFSTKVTPHPQVSSEIVLVSESEFYRYLESNEKVLVDESDPRFHQYIEPTSKSHNFIPIQFNNMSKFYLKPIVRFTNPLLQNCYKYSSTISFSNITPEKLKIFQVGLMFIETNILVVPKNFTIEQWKGLTQFANYFCVDNLIQIIQKFLIAKVDFANISELSMVSCDMKMPNLMHKCSQVIIQREEQNFFGEKCKIKKANSYMLGQFEQRFFSNLENFLYPLQFQSRLTREFQINKLSILLRNIQKLKQLNNNQKGKMVEENEEKQNEQNLMMSR